MSKMLHLNKTKHAKWIILILSIVIAIILIYYHHYQPGDIVAKFENLPDYLPPDDIHFINDPDISNILNPISDFKMKDKDNNVVYINVFQHKTIKTDKFTYKPLGQHCSKSLLPLTDREKTNIKKHTEGLHIITSSSITPISFNNMWDSDSFIQDDKTEKKIHIWHPVAQVDTVIMSDFITMSDIPPNINELPCLPVNLVTPIKLKNYSIIWSASNSYNSQIYCRNLPNYYFLKCTNKNDNDTQTKEIVYDISKETLEKNTLKL